MRKYKIAIFTTFWFALGDGCDIDEKVNWTLSGCAYVYTPRDALRQRQLRNFVLAASKTENKIVYTFSCYILFI